MQPVEVARLFSTEQKSNAYDPTPEDVKACWKHFSSLYGTRLIDKEDDELMQFIATFLSIGKGMTRDDFLDRYVTTIGRGVYLPFVPGEPNPDGWSLWAQMVTCVHEHCHVDQYDASDTKNAVDFSIQYLLKKRRRTRFEIEAYSTGLELHFWRFGQTREFDSILNALSAYRVGDLDIKVARKALELNNEMISNGAVLTRASAEFFRWAESRGLRSIR